MSWQLILRVVKEPAPFYPTSIATGWGAFVRGGLGEGRLLAAGPRHDGAAQPGKGRQRTHKGAQVRVNPKGPQILLGGPNYFEIFLFNISDLQCFVAQIL